MTFEDREWADGEEKKPDRTNDLSDTSISLGEGVKKVDQWAFIYSNRNITLSPPTLVELVCLCVCVCLCVVFVSHHICFSCVHRPP